MYFLAAAVLPEYTRVRVPDDHAIADLAMYNYIEVIIFLQIIVYTLMLNLNSLTKIFYIRSFSNFNVIQQPTEFKLNQYSINQNSIILKKKKLTFITPP